MLKRIRVQNFKSLKDMTLDLGQRNVLVGANMAGKSNIIDVFRFVYDMVFAPPGVHALPNAFNKRGGFSEVAWKGDNPSMISVSMCGDHPDGYDWEYSISILGSERGGFTVQNENLTVDRTGSKFELIQKEAGQRILKNVDGRTLSSIPESERSSLEFEIPDWEGNALRQLFASIYFYQLIPALMRTANPTSAANFLMQNGENLSSWLLNLQTRYQEEFSKIRAVARDSFPELEDLFTVPTQQATVFVASREKHLRRPISIWQMSDGELVFLALLSLIFSPPDLTAEVYLVEDPEAYLHPRLVETMMELLKQVQKPWEPEKAAQIVFTTHSPQVVDKFSIDELIVVERRNGATLCTRPGDKRHLRELLEREDVGLGDLFYTGALSDASSR